MIRTALPLIFTVKDMYIAAAAQLISTFVFPTQIVQFLFYLGLNEIYVPVSHPALPKKIG